MTRTLCHIWSSSWVESTLILNKCSPLQQQNFSNHSAINWILFFQATFLYCESYLFWQGGLLLHTATLCWPLPPLPTFSYCVHSLYQLILVARALEAWRASQHLYELMLLGPVSHFGTSICWPVLRLLFVLQSWPQSSCVTLCHIQTPLEGMSPESCHGSQHTQHCSYFMALCTPVSHMNTILHKMHLSITWTGMWNLRYLYHRSSPIFFLNEAWSLCEGKPLRIIKLGITLPNPWLFPESGILAHSPHTTTSESHSCSLEKQLSCWQVGKPGCS